MATKRKDYDPTRPQYEGANPMIVLRKEDLERAGLALNVSRDEETVTICGLEPVAPETMDSAFDFCQGLNLTPWDQDEVIGYALQLSLWSSVKRITRD